MSILGTLGAALGAAVVVASAFLSGATLEGLDAFELAVLVAGGGLLAAVLDSALGATVQARYRAPDGRLTERSTSSTGPLELAKGVRWMDNDRVNLACTAFGGLWPLVWLV